jgi:hypothetical protein
VSFSVPEWVRIPPSSKSHENATHYTSSVLNALYILQYTDMQMHPGKINHYALEYINLTRL